MSTAVMVLLVVVVAAALLGLAWWSSGRARAGAPSAATRAAGDVQAIKQYRPSGGTPPNFGGGGSS